jgi:membrane-bound metal-dependent hydrolase YbcI (DUF457 family)
MILGHFAVAGIAKQTRFKNENLIFLTLAAIGPDLFDKPANILFGMPGRGMSHSLTMFAVLIAISWVVLTVYKQDSRLLVAGMVMWGSHLLGDFLQFQILLWPFLGSLEPGPKFNLLEKLRFFYIDQLYPEQFWSEILCVSALLSIFLFRLFISRTRGPVVLQESGSSAPNSDAI